jgi:hypothetical protein
MDASLYESRPGFVTSLHAIEVPQIPDQKLQFPGGQNMNIPAGATICKEHKNATGIITELTNLVFSGARNFELLSPDEQEFATNTTVQYAPRAYEWIRDCKATPDGLTIEKMGREKALDQLPEWTWDKVQSFPVC